jgi:hypothetical protein
VALIYHIFSENQCLGAMQMGKTALFAGHFVQIVNGGNLQAN